MVLRLDVKGLNSQFPGGKVGTTSSRPVSAVSEDHLSDHCRSGHVEFKSRTFAMENVGQASCTSHGLTCGSQRAKQVESGASSSGFSRGVEMRKPCSASECCHKNRLAPK